MKNLFTFLLLTMIVGFVNAQNWQPINAGKSYNYILGTGDIITNVIKTDSVEIVDGDSVFYFNRIFSDCDTCSNNANNEFALRNQPQFLMRQMIKTSDSVLIFTDPHEFILRPLATVDETWLFDSLNAITAMCSSIEEVTVLGVLDSLKTITLSNGKQISISKNYGITSFPSNDIQYYTLVGIEGQQDIGEHLPGFFEFYDYSVGDVFQYNYSSGGQGYYYSKITKYTILTKDIYDESLVYTARMNRASWQVQDYYNHSDTIYNNINVTLSYNNSEDLFVNYYPNRFYDLSSICNYNDVNEYFAEIKLEKLNGRWVKYVGDIELIGNTITYHTTDIHPDLLQRNFDQIDMYEKYTQGLMYEYELSDFEYGEGEYLMGYIKDGVTTGDVYGNVFFNEVGVENLNMNAFKIFPNPTKNEIVVEFDEFADSFVIIDMMGCIVRVISNGNNMETQIIDVSGLKQGVYLIQVKKEGITVGINRFVKE